MKLKKFAKNKKSRGPDVHELLKQKRNIEKKSEQDSGQSISKKKYKMWRLNGPTLRSRCNLLHRQLLVQEANQIKKTMDIHFHQKVNGRKKCIQEKQSLEKRKHDNYLCRPVKESAKEIKIDL